jgi:hypothetical protein
MEPPSRCPLVELPVPGFEGYVDCRMEVIEAGFVARPTTLSSLWTLSGD